MAIKQVVKIEGKEVVVSNLDKILWEDLKITKGQVLEYYARVAPTALKFWVNRPVTVTRFPHGIDQPGFYQKNCPDYAPDWVNTVQVGKVEYILCNDLATLIWLANQSALEIHPAIYQINQLDTPCFAVVDLDPTPPHDFVDAAEVAIHVKEILEELGLKGYPKTSGATGLHIYIPLQPKYTFEQTSRLVEFIGEILINVFPQKVTNQRLIKNRHGVYIDHLQNSASRTMAGVYSLRSLPGAPISTPVTWSELPNINPLDFNILSINERLEQVGDLFAGVSTDFQSLDHVLDLLQG